MPGRNMPRHSARAGRNLPTDREAFVFRCRGPEWIVHGMIENREQSEGSRRLSSLRRRTPADTTLENLLSLLSTKLDLCSRLPVCEWQAADEGHRECASAFHEFAEAERRSCAEVLECLRGHLENSAPRMSRG